jgi:PAS domain S-box-containing protein
MTTRSAIRRKILLVLVGVLALSTTLNALLASYFTDRQNERAAFAGLRKDLLAWETELQSLTAQLQGVALATVGDAAILDQLGELMTVEFNVNDPHRVAERTEWARVLGYRKVGSLNRLQLAVRTGGFSSIAVYMHGRLSHAVSPSDAGMSVLRPDGLWAWVSASVDAQGQLPFKMWPAWKEGPRHSQEVLSTVPAQPGVSFIFPTSGDTVIEIAVPIMGYAEEARTDAPQPVAKFYSELSVAGDATQAETRSPAPGVAGRKPEVLAVIIFRKLIDRTTLENVARVTGEMPALLSPDGRYKQLIADHYPMPPDLQPPTRETGASRFTSSGQRVVSAGADSFYVAWMPWPQNGQPRLVLALAAPREDTLANIRQTVLAILLVSGATMMLSVVVGLWWVKRFTDPIVRLTAAIKRIRTRDREGYAPARRIMERLPAQDLLAPGEVGALAQAFNDMISELQRSFETLEQRVQARTAELRQQARYLRTLIDMLPMRAWFKDTESRFLAVNQAEAQVCGVTPDDLVGKSDLDVWPEDIARAYRADDAEVMRTRQRKTIEETRTLPDGTVWLESFKAPVIDEDGTVLGTVGVVRDISERKAAEAARESALAEAQRLARLRSEFLAQMSHELRTPLNAILGYARILQDSKSHDEQNARGLRIIEDSGRHLLGLIEDILDMARIDAAKLTLHPTDVDPSNFLTTVCDIVSSNAEQKGLVFECQRVGPLPPAVRVDEKRLRQVLLNLLSNAIKFTDRGRVVLRVQASPLPSGDAEQDKQIVRLRFEVHDTGIGLSEAQLKRLFQPFEQVAESTRREGGSGLGLAISRQLVRLMGGDVEVQSQLGEGSIFSFQLDLPMGMVPGAVAQVAGARAAGYRGPRKKVLVVDDVEENRIVLRERLTALGFEVLEAAGGQEALDVAGQTRPAMVLMDAMMPGMDGFEATRRLRQTRGLSDVPVIMTSASTSPEVRARSREAGAIAFIAKPIDETVLLEHLSSFAGLTWIYKKPGDVGDELVFPPDEEMQVLRHLARVGNMRLLRERAEQLQAMDARYTAFAARIAHLAAGFQSRAIRALVEDASP